MSQNLQLQKTVNIHARRIRHRRRLITTDPRFRSRHAGLDNFLTREAARANASPLRLVGEAIAAAGSGYVVGDQFDIAGKGYRPVGQRGFVPARHCPTQLLRRGHDRDVLARDFIGAGK